MLAGLDVKLPPIIVHRATMRVVDGTHRLGAALLRGDDMIEVQFFDGSEQEAFVLAVEANITHGMPLSLADRTTAAERIIASHPMWSDRAIAAAVGLGATTVGGIRRRIDAEVDAHDGTKVRMGRDGRVRPLDNVEGRLKACAFIKERPNASLREIARSAGVSPSTARDVRNRLQRGDSPVPQGRPMLQRHNNEVRSTPTDGPLATESAVASMLRGLMSDPSLRFTESGRALLRWIISRAIHSGEWRRVAGDVPPHCTYVMADVARHCADEWLQLADDLEKRLG